MFPLMNTTVQYGHHPRTNASTQYGYHSSRRHKRRRKRAKGTRNFRALWVVLTGGVVLCLAIVVTLLLVYAGIRLQVCVELGTPLPSANVFSNDGKTSVAYISDVSSIDTSVAGDHWIHVSASGNDRLVVLTVKDTVAPLAQPVEIEISVSQEISPDQLVTSLQDASAVKLQWEKAPTFGTVGDYPVVIKLQDMSGNTSTVTSMVHIRAVEDAITRESGSTPPVLADFLVDDSLSASLVTDIASLPLDTPGQYDVQIDISGTSYTSKLVIADTVQPQATMKAVFIHPGESAAPQDFVETVTDATALSYAFEAEPDFSHVGTQDVGIVITDLGGNAVRQTATLLISNIAPITIEARETAVTVDEFNVSGYSSVSLVTQLIPSELGDHVVDLLLDGQTNSSIVTVVDTTPPRGQSVNGHWYLNHPITANRLVKNEHDTTGITYTYETEPDWTKTEMQNVNVILTDAAGNTATVTSQLTLTADTEAPELYGVKDRYCYIGQAVAYFAEVSAKDNCDEEVTIDVDKSQVNINAGGTYTVTYTATDSSGNTVSHSCKFTFIEESVMDDDLAAVADQVLAEIITPDMSIGKKAWAVYEYVFGHIRYNGTSNKTDWKYEAYRGITEGRGDCFTFYATAKCLLERIGAQTMCVERHGGKSTHHYWLLVNLGTGWYHFDAINVGPENYVCFMRTDQEILARSGDYFWSFDRSLYPPSPTEKFVLE